MGFFSQFKREPTTKQDTEGACGRALSLFPSKHESQRAANPSHQSAKSFSYAAFSKFKAEQAASEEALRSAGREQRIVQYTTSSQFTNMIVVYNGSISTVYRAKCAQTGQRMIVKVYYLYKMSPKQMHKLDREIELQNLVKGCPYVCQVFSSFVEGSEMYIVLEDCEGGDLFKKMIKQGGYIPESQACIDVIVPLLRVLEVLDQLNIIHRDIKPENIFLTAAGQIRLGDFGLAIDCGKEIPFYRSGTLDFMAPEVLINPSTSLEEHQASMAELEARNIVPYTTKVDVWATGVLAYELVSGQPPFAVAEEVDTVKLILTSDDIRTPACYSREWADFVKTVLVKKARKRPSASALLEHPWIVKHMSRAAAGVRVAEMERLQEPISIEKFAPQLAAMISARSPDACMEALPDMGSQANQPPASDLSAGFGTLLTLDGKGSISFAVPAGDCTDMPVPTFGVDEKTETGAAIGMRARMQLYMNRQRLSEYVLARPHSL